MDGLSEDRLHKLKNICISERLDILAVQETHIRIETNRNIDIPGYKVWRSERKGEEDYVSMLKKV